MYYNGNYDSTLLVLSDKVRGRIKVNAGVITVPTGKLKDVDMLCRELKCRTYSAFYLDAKLSKAQGQKLFKLMDEEVKIKIATTISLKNI